MYPQTVLLGIGLYEIFLTVGILVAFFAADRLAVKSGFSLALQRVLIVAFLAAIALGFFGAVLFQAFYNFMKTGVFMIDGTTGMTFYGGLIFGVGAFLAVWFLGGKFFCKEGEAVKRFGSIADIAACLIPLAHAFGRIGCLFAGCCHGKETNAWYGVQMHTETGLKTVVPVQLFEAVFLFALAAALLVWLWKGRSGSGFWAKVPLLAVYALLYGAWRFCIEYARGDDRGASGIAFLSPSQLTAIVLVIVGAVWCCFVFFRKERGNKESENSIENSKQNSKNQREV